MKGEQSTFRAYEKHGILIVTGLITFAPDATGSKFTVAPVQNFNETKAKDYST
jgi:hypothetical protein